MSKSNLLEELEITVMKKTAEDLEKIAEKMELSVGEVVDLLAEKMAPKEYELAALIIFESIIATCGRLNHDDFLKAIEETVKTLLGIFTPGDMGRLVAEAIVKRNDSIRETASLSDDQYDELIEYFRELRTFDD